ncbi:MAG: phosphatidylinositol mannoside acyltransferase [Actinomycetota bacterium]|nr:phosphatidylinositol mannoside acyltransferase [Actinomycetota bacterium]
MSPLTAAELRTSLMYAGYAAGWAGVRRLPEQAAYRLFARAADAAWQRRGPSVRQLEANLRRVAPGAGERALRELSRAGMRSYLRYWCDVFRMPNWDRDRIVGAVTPVGEEQLRTALGQGRGFVAALPHLGNWDHAGAWACLTGAPVTTVAERLRPERLYERFAGFRAGLGMEILPLTAPTGAAERALLGTLADRLRANRVVCLLADRDLRASGIPVDFFGARATMPPGPALLAVLTGAPLHPVTPVYDERGIVLTIAAEVVPPATGTTRHRVAAATQQVADVFADAIAAAPQDWHMLQPLWLDGSDGVGGVDGRSGGRRR